MLLWRAGAGLTGAPAARQLRLVGSAWLALAIQITCAMAATALGLRARAQRLCAHHAGGGQLVADSVVQHPPVQNGVPAAVR